MEQNKNPIKSYGDLDVYRNSYFAAIKVIREILPKLPQNERYDLADQLRRSCKAIPRLIAEGYAKRHQKLGFQKYLDDAMAEANETHVGLCQCRDIYGINCDELIETYNISGKQLYRLSEAWTNFKFKHIEKQEDWVKVKKW
jgi:four helix bundle protein